jgi:hypothetical protein
VVWWVPSEEPALVAVRLAELAHALGMATVTDPVAAAVARLLGALRERDRWLLIFDNAEEPAVLARYLPGYGGQVVITSRNPGWYELATPVGVDVFDRGESIALQRRRAPQLPSPEVRSHQVGDLLRSVPIGPVGPVRLGNRRCDLRLGLLLTGRALRAGARAPCCRSIAHSWCECHGRWWCALRRCGTVVCRRRAEVDLLTCVVNPTQVAHPHLGPCEQDRRG